MSARSDFCAIPSIIYVSGMIKVKSNQHIVHWQEHRHNSKFCVFDLLILSNSPFYSEYFGRSFMTVSLKLTNSGRFVSLLHIRARAAFFLVNRHKSDCDWQPSSSD